MSIPETYKALIVQPDHEELKLEDVPIPKPGKNQVLVKIAFAPINPSDMEIISGRFPLPMKPPHPVGFEASGTVVALGEELKRAHQVGDNVHLTSRGTFGQYVLADSDRCRKIQGSLTMEEAACHLANPLTVVAMGHLVNTEEHKAVVHTAGSSAIGRMMIRYFKYRGIKTINIVRRDEYIEELKKEGADYVLNSKAPDFEAKLKEAANQIEATIAFDAVGGEMCGTVLKNLPENSTAYIYGALAGHDLSKLNVQQFIFEGKTISGFFLGKYLEKIAKKENIQNLYDESYRLLPTLLKSNIHKIFKLDEHKEALAYYEEHSSKGKILFTPN